MDVYVLAMESILDIIQEMIDRYVVNPLYEMNGVPEEFRATLVHEPVHRDDLKQFCENMKGLLDAGAITGDAPLEDHIREKLSLPPRALEDELDVGVGISNLDGAGDPSDTPDGNAPGKPAPTEPNQEKPATVAQKLKWLDRLFGREVP
jgi:hypothetical protein